MKQNNLEKISNKLVTAFLKNKLIKASYDIDNNLYFNAPIGNYSDNIKINFYKIYIQKK